MSRAVSQVRMFASGVPAILAVCANLGFAALEAKGQEALRLTEQVDQLAITTPQPDSTDAQAGVNDPKPEPPQIRVRAKALSSTGYQSTSVSHCNYPWTYSSRSKRCVCRRQGHGIVDGRCVARKVSCSVNSRWLPANNACVCNEGFEEWRGQCLTRRAAAAARAKAEEAAGPWLKFPNAYLVQRCLAEAGYLKVSPRRKMGAKAWTAFWFFKQDHKVGKTPDGIRNSKAIQTLFTQCPRVDAEMPRRPTVRQGNRKAVGRIVDRQGEKRLGQSMSAEVSIRINETGARIGCLPGRLHKLIVDSYGPRPELRRCPRRCVSIPADFKRAEISEYETRRGINWCRSCIEISSNLPLSDVLKIEQGGNVQLCPRAPTRLPERPSSTRSSRDRYAGFRSIYKAYPATKSHARDFAVVIGNRSYRGGIAKNMIAHDNAAAVYSFLTEKLGFPSEHILDLRDAGRDDLVRVFGSKDSPRGALWQRLVGRPSSRVLVYYAGHGFTKPDLQASYLLPVDALKHREDRTGYPLSLLYSNLAQLKAKSVLVLLEAGFGRDTGRYIFPPNIPEQRAFSLPGKSLQQLVAISAAEGDQKPLNDPRFHLGLFTRYAIEGLAGQADVSPVGNDDRRVDSVELYAFVANMVGLASRKSYGLVQQPVLSQRNNAVLSVRQARRR